MYLLRFVRLFGLLLLVCLCLGAGHVAAQISEGGTPPSFTLRATSPFTPQSAWVAPADAVPTVQTKMLDVPALLAEDAIEQEKGIPYRFGYPFEVTYDMTSSGTWDTLPDGGRLWRLRIECPDAYSINLVYRKFWLPPNAKFFVYDDNQDYVIGAFTERNNKEYGAFATAPVPGAVSILEYYEPPNTSEPGIISIQRIVHGYKDIFAPSTIKEATGFGSSGSCNNNVNCPEGELWQDDKRAVAMILTSGGYRICTGTLVNNVREDFTPYFLTANHCLGSETSWIFMFNYESPTCTNVDGPTWMTVQGSIRRANSYGSDFALLELLEQPPDSYNVYYAGWSAIDNAAQSAVGIHHPSGDIKKISIDYDPVVNANYGGVQCWRVVQWDDGTTEPGSSGSPLFDSLTHRIVGQLYGGTASCDSWTSDFYGKFSVSWTGNGTPATRLKDWLDPDSTGALVLDGLDPNGVTFTAIPTMGDAPLDVEFAGASQLAVDSWTWAFGDGDSAYVQAPAHRYASPGTYDVTLTVTAGADTARRYRTDYIVVLADTLRGSDQIVPKFSEIQVTIDGANTLPLTQIQIPLQFAGTLDLTLDSLSTIGCRTDYFESKSFVDFNNTAKQATIQLISSYTGSSPPLDPGVGPLVKLWFTVGSATGGDSTVINLAGYNSFAPRFAGSLAVYEPKIESPVLAYENCCIGIRGDVDLSGAINVADLSYLIAYLFRAGPEPSCMEEADVDLTGVVSVADVTYLIAFLFRGGPDPYLCSP